MYACCLSQSLTTGTACCNCILSTREQWLFYLSELLEYCAVLESADGGKRPDSWQWLYYPIIVVVKEWLRFTSNLGHCYSGMQKEHASSRKSWTGRLTEHLLFSLGKRKRGVFQRIKLSCQQFRVGHCKFIKNWSKSTRSDLHSTTPTHTSASHSGAPHSQFGIASNTFWCITKKITITYHCAKLA